VVPLLSSLQYSQPQWHPFGYPKASTLQSVLLQLALIQGAVGPLVIGAVALSAFGILLAFILPTFYLMNPMKPAGYVVAGYSICWISTFLFFNVPTLFYLRWRTSVRVKSESKDPMIQT
jgi:CBS domain containing-hemolysin-like protein